MCFPVTVRLAAAYEPCSPRDCGEILSLLLGNLRIAVELCPPSGSTGSTVALDVSPTAESSTLDVAARQLRISAVLPRDTQHGSSVALVAASLPSVGAVESTHKRLPARTVVLTRGVSAPAIFPGVGNDPNWVTPCVSSDGYVFLPEFGRDSISVRAGDAVSPFRPLVDLDALGIPSFVRSVAIDEEAGLLYVAPNTSGGDLSALSMDRGMYAVKWRAPIPNGCMGIAALPLHGVVVVGMRGANEVRVLRALDGQLMSQYRTTSTVYTASADPESGLVCFAVQRDGVHVCQWNGRELLLRTRVTCAFGNTGALGVLLAVMPRCPAVGGRWGGSAHLIIGWAEAAVDLPGRACIFALRPHAPFVGEATAVELPRVVPREGGDGAFDYARCLDGIHGLAADPGGTALLVCERSESSHDVMALPWPLPGMSDW